MMRMEAVRRRSLCEKKGHTVLSYLQSDGSQVIFTGIIGRSGIKVEAKVHLLSGTHIFGSRNGTPQNSFNFLFVPNQFRSDYNLATTLMTGNTNVPITVIKANNRTYIDGVLKAVETVVSFNSARDIVLFGVNTNGTTSLSTCRFYYFKAWDESGTLVQSLIPVLKSSVYCMYDEVTGTYFYNQGTGSFTGA